MKNILIISDGKFKTRRVGMLFGMALISALLIFGQMAMAQDASVTDKNISQPADNKNTEKYFTVKYKKEISEVFSTIKETPNGPEGYISIIGKITPKTAIVGKNTNERSRSIANAFIKEEASHMGIAKPEEYKESSLSTDGLGYTHINYHRYVGDLPMDEGNISVHIDPDGAISSVIAKIVPVSSELYQATAKTTLTESDIRRIIEDDINATINSPTSDPMVKNLMKKADIGKMRLEKVAISSAPYVVFRAYSVWVYTIDAFTGQILKKIQGWQD